MADTPPKNKELKNPLLSILMPVRNEGANAKIMLRILQATVDAPHEILVVHDSPDDDTIPPVREMQASDPSIRLVHNTLGVGVINAIKAGASVARGEYILIFAIDDIGPVLAIDDMLRLMDGGCDFVSATRYARGGRRFGGSLIGRLLSSVGNWSFRLLSGSVFTDATTGIKMIRKTVFDRMILDSNPVGWAVALEMAIKVQNTGLRVAEVPIVAINRLYGGKSTFSLNWLGEYVRLFLWGIWDLGVRRWLG